MDVVELAPRNEDDKLSIGAFMSWGLQSFYVAVQENDLEPAYSSNGNTFTTNWKLMEGVFSIHRSTEWTYTSADLLLDLDFKVKEENLEFPSEQITIAKGYLTVLNSLASVM